MREEAPTAEQVAELDRMARAALVRAAAMAALVEADCRHPELFAPVLVRELRCIHVGEGEFGVVAVDEKGEPRAGARGPMTPAEAAAELRRDPGFNDIWTR